MMKKIKNLLAALMRIYLVIMWLMLFPFVYLFDRLFGRWRKNAKSGR
jgi:hypothetical protein